MVVVLCFAAAVLLAGLRTLVLPNIDYYRPQIEALLSRQLGARVTIGSIHARWARSLRVQLRDVQWRDERGWSMLAIPQVDAVLSWRSLLDGTPQLSSLQASGPDLLLRRDRHGQLWLLGQPLMTRDAPLSAQAAAPSDALRLTVQWLASQPQLRVYEARLRWLDESRSAAPLILDGLDINIRNEGEHHRFSVLARPAHAPAQRVELRGDFHHPAGQPAPRHLRHYEGTLYAHVANLRPADWAQWLAWPEAVRTREVDARLWLTHRIDAQARLTGEFRMREAHWQTGEGASLAAQDLRLIMATPWAPLWQHWREPGRVLGDVPRDVRTGAQFQVQGKDLALDLPHQFIAPLAFATVTGAGLLQQARDGLRVQLARMDVMNADFEANATGQWQGGPQDWPGRIDAQLQLPRMALAAIHRYLPLAVDDEVHAWLRAALRGGDAHAAQLRLRGRLRDFPFDAPGADGEFSAHIPFSAATLDYVPGGHEGRHWPPLLDLQGAVDVAGAQLSVTADTAHAQPADDQPLALAGIRAVIPDLRGSSVLEVNGRITGEAPAFMALVAHSPVAPRLAPALAQTQVDGGWALDLGLKVPLAHPVQTQVTGRLAMSGSQLRLAPQVPALEQVDGVLEFDHDAVRAVQAEARFLGTAVTLSGDLAPKGKGLSLRGRFDAASLARQLGAPALQRRLSGQTDLRLHLSDLDLRQASPAWVLALDSDLKGVGLRLPPPLDKAAAQAWPLAVRWSSAGTLSVTLRETLQARFERGAATAAGSYFQRGVIAAGQAMPALPPQGLHVSIAQPAFDADAWDAIVRELSAPAGQGAADANPVLPPLADLRLAATQANMLGMALDDLDYHLAQVQPGQWRADIRAWQAQGSVRWAQQGGRVEGPLQAVFQRLALGESGASSARWQDDTAQEDDAPPVQIPDVNLKVAQLSFQGRALGELIASGSSTHEDGGRIWHLHQVTLSSPSAHLEGKGLWRLRGPFRGLTLDATIDVSDLGDYLAQIGFPDLVQGGEGTVHGLLQWHDLPWRADIDKLSGDLEFKLAKGRLNTVNSHTAQLLELLSLQSVRRLARLDLATGGVAREGFAYDVLRGALQFQDGQLRTRDYRIVGPAGTIVLEGLVALKTGTLDLEAVVVPNLDVSGAAIAAGVAINPVVGIGAFLGQWLLKTPLAAAMTARYRIQGDWDAPQIQPVERLVPEESPAPGR